MLNNEIWRDIKNYEGLYQVSSLGRVRSVKNRCRLLGNYLDGKGYPIARLCKNGKAITINVHRLVAKAFIPNPLNKPAVNHINSTPTDNRASNLEWCTIAENNRHSLIAGRRKPAGSGQIYRSTFNKAERAELFRLFDMGVGVTAIATQLGLKYHTVRYIYRLKNNAK